ncbi:oligosaccharide flippase family protein [Treponema sp.]|uniref:oligosaccharide flippase family protein n=1 Tax=Treponema sp. TaxID=166 RepID=UPI003F102D66
MSNSTRIAKNTIALYFRQILIMLVGLYTVRVVLATLGAEDYGIYNVVAGVVTMLSFLSGSMATASQRYFSYDIGKNDTEKLKRTFSTTFEIYVLLGIIIIILAETLGLWFVCNKLVIPDDRMNAVKWGYQFALLNFLLTLITTPYMAGIIAHEKMNIYAYMSIVEIFLKLAIVYFLKIFKFDKLISYAFLLCVAQLISTSFYILYCRRHYEEFKVEIIWDKSLFTEILSYSVWNLFGSVANVVKNQFKSILLNLFFCPIVNAARAIASQVNAAVNSFAQNFSTALRPQLVKSFALGNTEETYKLVYSGCKFAFFLMYIFTLPLTLEMNYIFTLWLKNPPEYSVWFTRLVLFDVCLDCLNYQIMTLVQATGKIKLYQGLVGGLIILNLPVSYLCLNIYTNPYIVEFVSIAITLIAGVVRLFIVKRLLPFSIIDFLKKVILRSYLAALIAAIVPFFVVRRINESFGRLCLTVVVSVVCSGISIYFIGLVRSERQKIKEFILYKLGKM